MPWVKFYIMQALGIHFEDFLIWCYKQVAGKPKPKASGQDKQELEVEPKLWHRLVGYVLGAELVDLPHRPGDACLSANRTCGRGPCTILALETAAKAAGNSCKRMTRSFWILWIRLVHIAFLMNN